MSSWPPNLNFNQDLGSHHPNQGSFYTIWDDSYGQGQTIFIMEKGIVASSQEIQGRFQRLPNGLQYGPANVAITQDEEAHGTVVAALAGGIVSGIARKANIVFTEILVNVIKEKNLEALIKIAAAAAQIPKDTCIVNMSWGLNEADVIQNFYFLIMIKLMQAMEKQYGCIFVAAPGNDGQPVAAYPAQALTFMKGMMVVGAVNPEGKKYTLNSAPAIITANAPGVDLQLFGSSWTGTSFAAPQVAGITAYFRAHPSWSKGKDPRSMFDGIQGLSRQIQYNGLPISEALIIWNGQTDSQCAPLKRGLEGRQLSDGPSCPLPGGGNGPGGPPGPQAPRVEFKSGTPGPLCTGSGCGKLCSGFYCSPSPTGTPPDFSVPPSNGTMPAFTPRPGESCLSQTTIRQCNGGPRDAVCSTTTECASWGRSDSPTPIRSIPFSQPGGSWSTPRATPMPTPTPRSTPNATPRPTLTPERSPSLNPRATFPAISS
ncbi:peptidase S8/S53 domain-containing protein [Paraphoma chrysanthemicola]|nr:peptidase S8/S53 domain-containing protein [Paraphoma chrysanthemicola]